MFARPPARGADLGLGGGLEGRAARVAQRQHRRAAFRRQGAQLVQQVARLAQGDQPQHVALPHPRQIFPDPRLFGGQIHGVIARAAQAHGDQMRQGLAVRAAEDEDPPRGQQHLGKGANVCIGAGGAQGLQGRDLAVQHGGQQLPVLRARQPRGDAGARRLELPLPLHQIGLQEGAELGVALEPQPPRQAHGRCRVDTGAERDLLAVLHRRPDRVAHHHVQQARIRLGQLRRMARDQITQEGRRIGHVRVSRTRGTGGAPLWPRPDGAARSMSARAQARAIRCHDRSDARRLGVIFQPDHLAGAGQPLGRGAPRRSAGPGGFRNGARTGTRSSR